MTARAPNLTEKLAATILAWLAASGRAIPHEHQKAMSAHQVVSLVQFDHYPIRRADGGTNHPSNLQPLLILGDGGHRVKTAIIDQPQISKRKRIRRADDAAVNRLLARQTGDLVREPRKRRIPARVDQWPKGRKIQSRGFAKRTGEPLRRRP